MSNDIATVTTIAGLAACIEAQTEFNQEICDKACELIQTPQNLCELTNNLSLDKADSHIAVLGESFYFHLAVVVLATDNSQQIIQQGIVDDKKRARLQEVLADLFKEPSDGVIARIGNNAIYIFNVIAKWIPVGAIAGFLGKLGLDAVK